MGTPRSTAARYSSAVPHSIAMWDHAHAHAREYEQAAMHALHHADQLDGRGPASATAMTLRAQVFATLALAAATEGHRPDDA